MREIKAKASGTVYVVDHDSQAREQVASTAKELAMNCTQFDSAEAFLQLEALERPACIVANGHVPDTAGYKIQQSLNGHPESAPLILVGHGLEVDTAVELMERSVFTVLVKPYSAVRLATKLQKAIACDTERLAVIERYNTLNQYEQSLNDNERTVVGWLTQGALNKVIAKRMDLSVRMVETHRANILRKFSADSALEVVAGYSELRLLRDTYFRVEGPSKPGRRKPRSQQRCYRL